MNGKRLPPGRRRAGKLAGMTLLRGGTFLMGAQGFYDDEAPVRSMTVGAFWIDRTPVTNDQFAAFVAATGYRTFAEHAPDPAEYPGMPIELAQPGSIVFMPPSQPVALDGPPVWWEFVIGASWYRPYGPDSTIENIGDHPVVHVAPVDAAAYAAWAGKQLPNEAEWEFAARGGLDGATYAWGEAFAPDGVAMAKIWDGDFPHRNTAPPDRRRTAPVGSYPANGYGLYDMIGNVWELTDQDYDASPGATTPKCCGDPAVAAPGGTARKVAKGGSHLCSPDYCQRYRPAARWGHPVDTTTSHTGFRCIVRR